MTHPALIERITRSLAYMLRHQPEEFELELDSHGFGRLDEVVRALNERLGEPVEAPDVEEAIATGDRPRYEIVDDRVRALYGHSIDVEPGETSKPPELLFVGLSSRDAKRAVQYGLRGGRRRFLHLALTLEDARETGRRSAREYSILTIHALDAWEDGVDFYDRQALYLAEQIPTDFLEITENHEDGQDRIPNGRGRTERGRGGRGGRGRDGDGERGGRGGRGGRGRGRDDEGRGRSQGRGDRDRGGEREREPARSERPERPERSERSERQPERGERQPERGERRPEPSERRPERSERRPERSERRPERSERRPERDDRPARREPKPEAPRPEPKRKPAPAKSGPTFGSGIFEEKPAPAQRRKPEPEAITPPAPRPEPERAPAPAPAPVPEPEPEPAARKAADDSPGFGAGV